MAMSDFTPLSRTTGNPEEWFKFGALKYCARSSQHAYSHAAFFRPLPACDGMVNPFADATNYEDCIRECAIRANKSNFPHSLPLTSKIKDAQEATEKLLELQEPFIKSRNTQP